MKKDSNQLFTNFSLLSASSDCSIGLFDTEEPISGTISFQPFFQIIKAHDFIITKVIWYELDTGIFFTSSYDKTVKVWDTNTQKSITSFKLFDKVNCIALSPCAKNHGLIASGTNLSDVKMCDIRTGACIQYLSGHSGSILSVHWSPSNEYILASAGTDKTIKLWDVRTSKYLLTFDQFKTSTKRYKSKTPISHHGAITSLVWSKDGRYLYSSGTDNEIKKWDIFNDENTMVSFPKIKNEIIKPNQFCLSNLGNVLYFPNGKDITFFNTETGQKLGDLSAHYGVINSCIYHPEYEEVYSCGADYQILIWANEKKELIDDQDDWSD